MKTTIKYIASILIALTALQGTTFGQDVDPPSTPTGLEVTEISSEFIRIIWDPSTDNVVVTGYRVYVKHGAR